jgi:integrase
LALGLRRGETLGLHWEIVDFDDEVIHPRRTLHSANGKLSIGPV